MVRKGGDYEGEPEAIEIWEKGGEESTPNVDHGSISHEHFDAPRRVATEEEQGRPDHQDAVDRAQDMLQEQGYAVRAIDIEEGVIAFRGNSNTPYEGVELVYDSTGQITAVNIQGEQSDYRELDEPVSKNDFDRIDENGETLVSLLRDGEPEKILDSSYLEQAPDTEFEKRNDY